jgi:hypothetical protein
MVFTYLVNTIAGLKYLANFIGRFLTKDQSRPGGDANPTLV